MRSFRPNTAQVPSVAGCALVILALTALLGWVFRNPTWQGLGLEFAAMKANTAIGLLLIGLALLRRDHPDAKIYSIAVWALGVTSIAEYLTHIDFGIDQLMFRDTFSPTTPGRISRLTSVGFVLAGTSLALMRSNRRWMRDLSRALALVTGGIGINTLLGYSFLANRVHQPIQSRTVAFGGALGFVIAAVGVEYSNYSEGFVRRILANNDAGRMLRRLLPTAVLLPYLIVLAVGSVQKHFGWGTSLTLTVITGSVVFTLVSTIIIYTGAVEREELARRESEQRFRFVSDSAPVMIWQSATDKLCNYFNKTWLEFTGRTLQQELRDGWAEGVHPEDLETCLDTYISSFDKREAFRMQYRLRRFDGKYRWILDIGVPRFAQDGSFAGYVGSCIDVTEQRLAEEALADFGRRLIQAQEEERTWIAQEIHDDYQQRLAMLAIQLEELALDPNLPRPETTRRLNDLSNRVSELGQDMHSLAHRLHSSTLKSAGLIPGLRSLCAEFTEHFGISATFEAQNVPDSLPDGVALCLFRVAQEALQNVKKHSGATAAEVRVTGHEGKIHLSISDQGNGFSPTTVASRAGIGIRSMQERIRLVGGLLELNTQPMKGSQIDAWVPIETHQSLLNQVA
jgi:PAS domain S-box-containing protein